MADDRKLTGHPRVSGYCPMGCGQTLMLGYDGRVTCSRFDCEDPTSVDMLLSDADLTGAWHVVRLGATRFDMQHPMRELLSADGDLFHCEVYAYVSSLPGPPLAPGLYRLHQDASGLANGSSWAPRWELMMAGDPADGD